MSDPWIEIGGSSTDNRTIGDALADLAVEYCQARDPSIRSQHVRTQLLFMLNRDRVIGRAVAEANRPAGEQDGVKPSLGDWERALHDWSAAFYPRMVKARGLRLSPEAVRVRTLAFARSLVEQMGYIEIWCMGAGKSQQAPVFDKDADDGGDPLLQELASGRKR